jgi:hypothetical protein
MKPSRRFAATRTTAIFIVGLLTLLFLGGCKDAVDKDEAPRQPEEKKGQAQISVENGQTVLTLDLPTQGRLGLEIVTLTPTVTRAQITSPAVVLSAQDLATFRNSYLAAQAQLQKSRIEGSVARKEYARLKGLFEDNQNISEKSLQSAEGALQANEADVRAGEQQLNLQESVVRQEWGSVVAKWAVEGSPELQRIFDQREVLAQMTLPADVPLGPPKSISLEISGGTRTEAKFISPFPRVDPRIQGKSFLYVAPAHSGLFPGVNLLAHLSTGKQMQGVIVPASAVVWSEGKAWVYQRTTADRFTRRAIQTDAAVEKGFFLATGLSPGDKVVTRGAQVLLSEELLLHAQGGGKVDVD